MKITIVIPNFNGEKLLQKNLPNILGSTADEVIVIDDRSKDSSQSILEEFEKVNDKLKIIIHQKNLGFLSTVNELFKEASGDIVVLLNNDVWVEKDFLKQIPKHFQDKKVFAVNLHEKGQGPSVAFWKDGFYEFKGGDEKVVVQKSSWASGGSAAFSKKIWDDLGGFDKIFAPFYWEDTDISFRAVKAGFEVLWEPDARVNHEHETTIRKTHNRKYIEWVKQRNQLLFIWKNINDPDLISEHRKALLKRLFSIKVGYWIPYLWALWKSFDMKKDCKGIRDDLATINYAQNPLISVIIISYNCEDFIEKCISSVLKFLPGNGEVIVLDNNSTDGTVKKLAKYGNQINLIKSKENLGFSKGNNKAVKEALGDYLFLLNPDTELEGPIDELLNFYDSKDIGVLAPKLVTPSGKVQESVKKLPSVWGAFKEYVLGIKNAYSQYAPETNNPTEVEMVYGAAMLIKRELYELLNGFDEKFFLYYEDADLCKRVRQMGKAVYYYPAISIKHLVGAAKSEQDRYKLNLESAKKYHGPFGAFMLQVIFLFARLTKKV